MSKALFCPSCGAVVSGDAPKRLCARCLIKQGMEPHTAGYTESGPARKGWEPPAPAELAGQFADVDVLELLGRGGMGAVYKARQKHLDRIVALKLLPPGIGQDPAFADRFAREARVLARLNHPNVVTLYEFGRTPAGLYYFLMEYVDGVHLRRLMDGGRVAPREALAIVPQVCDALQYAHDQGVVHRDIKPENILLDRLGRVKVADFGLAKLTGQDEAAAGGAFLGSDVALISGAALTEAGKVVGTLHYMAPEQAVSPGAVDNRADIYALGVVFYQMLTGELPGRPVEAPSRIIEVDVRLDEVMLRALARDPELRYTQASVMKSQVEAIAQSPALPPRLPPLTGAGKSAGKTGQPRYAGGVLSLRKAALICFAMAILLPVVGVLLARFGPPVEYSVSTRLLISRSDGSTKEVNLTAAMERAIQLHAADPNTVFLFERDMEGDIATVSTSGQSPGHLADRANSLAAELAESLRKEPGTEVRFLEGAHPPIRGSSRNATFLSFGLLCTLLPCIAGVFLLILASLRGRRRPQNANPAARLASRHIAAGRRQIPGSRRGHGGKQVTGLD